MATAVSSLTRFGAVARLDYFALDMHTGPSSRTHDTTPQQAFVGCRTSPRIDEFFPHCFRIRPRIPPTPFTMKSNEEADTVPEIQQRTTAQDHIMILQQSVVLIY